MKTIAKMVLPNVTTPFSSFSIHKTLKTQTPPTTTNYLKPSLSNSITNMSSFPKNTNRKLPILLFDIMDTIVRDPFYKDIPEFFGMSFNELIDCKHPTSWIEFEKGLIDEVKTKAIHFDIIHCKIKRPFFMLCIKIESFYNYEFKLQLGHLSVLVLMVSSFMMTFKFLRTFAFN
jgi:hypothetical protein